MAKELVIENRVIKTPLVEILKKVQSETNKVKQFKSKGEYVSVTCPSHKDGQESNPSCSLYQGDRYDVQYGTCHCFTCGFSGPLWHFIAECYNQSDEWGKTWLLRNFGDIFASYELVLPEIELPKYQTTKKSEFKGNLYQSYHPYMVQRKITDYVRERFQIKYDTASKSLVFPVWDEHNNFLFETRRSVVSKRFEIPEGVEKPIYLLNFVLQDGYKEVYVCESQINALTLMGWGYPAIALFGTGTPHQYNILNKSGIRRFHLCFDGDDAGDKGTLRFLKNIKKDKLVDIIKIPRGKDINDLTLEEFESLERN